MDAYYMTLSVRSALARQVTKRAKVLGYPRDVFAARLVMMTIGQFGDKLLLHPRFVNETGPTIQYAETLALRFENVNPLREFAFRVPCRLTHAALQALEFLDLRYQPLVDRAA